jgi:hypothetical protein
MVHTRSLVMETTFMPAKRTPGRRSLSVEERQSERLPPIYATPEFEARVFSAASSVGKDFSNFGREALEFYIEHLSAPREQPDELRITKLDEGLLAKIKRTAKQVLGRDDADIFGHMLLQRAVDMPAASVKKLLLGDYESMANLAKEKAALPQEQPRLNSTKRAA